MIKIPQDVYDVINNKNEGFDKMFYKHLSEEQHNEKAFEKTMDRMREYFPNYKGYSCYLSYVTYRNRRNRKMMIKNKRRTNLKNKV